MSNEELVQKIFDKMDELWKFASSINARVTLLEFQANAAIAEKQLTQQTRSQVSAGVILWAVTGTLTLVGAVTYFAVKHGWKP